MHRDRRGYAYETFREAGSVKRRYLGAGEDVSLSLTLEQLKRKLEQRTRGQKEEERLQERHEVENPVALLDAQTSEILAARLQAAGYYRHRRGEWRKARIDTMSKAIETQAKAQLRALQERAQNGDREAAREFWRQVDAGACSRASLVKQTGDLADISLRHLVAKISDKDPLIEGGIWRQLDAMRGELSGLNPSPLETLLVERVCVCWLQLHYFEACYSLSLAAPFEEQLFRQKQVDGANRRYLSSIKAIAQVRKLQLPTLQINVAEKQVNIGQVSGQAFGD